MPSTILLPLAAQKSTVKVPRRCPKACTNRYDKSRSSQRDLYGKSRKSISANWRVYTSTYLFVQKKVFDWSGNDFEPNVWPDVISLKNTYTSSLKQKESLKSVGVLKDRARCQTAAYSKIWDLESPVPEVDLSSFGRARVYMYGGPVIDIGVDPNSFICKWPFFADQRFTSAELLQFFPGWIWLYIFALLRRTQTACKRLLCDAAWETINRGRMTFRTVGAPPTSWALHQAGLHYWEQQS